MQLTLKVIFNDGTSNTVTTNLMNLVAWERKYKRKASHLNEGIGVEDLAYLAYEASRSAGISVPALLDEYIKSLTSLDVLEQASPKAGVAHTATD